MRMLEKADLREFLQKLTFMAFSASNCNRFVKKCCEEFQKLAIFQAAKFLY